MNVLVTGSKGMIGTQLVEGLLHAGNTVIGIDRIDGESKGQYHHHKLNLSERTALQSIVEDEKVDRIIHLAALAHTEGETELTWERYKTVNVEYAKNVFSVADYRPVLFISTVDVFGFFDGKKPVNEHTPIKPVSNYGKSKALAEEECKKLQHYTIFRFSPVYTDSIKRDIQKRYYLKYPHIAYKIGKGSTCEILNITRAVEKMVIWCNEKPNNRVKIIKDEVPMWTPDYIKAERAVGRATIIIRFPRVAIRIGYRIIHTFFGDNEKTYLLNKAVYPLRSEGND